MENGEKLQAVFSGLEGPRRRFGHKLGPSVGLRCGEAGAMNENIPMLAATYGRTGSSAVISVGEVDRPEPGAGEVRVRLAVSGVNPTDWKARAATGAELPGPFQIPGHDGAGTIDAVGSGVSERRIGERVWVYFAAWRRPWGTAAQWTVVPAAHAITLPDGATNDLGASLGIPAMTAYSCLFADGPIAGQTVLVAGGAGAVGHAAIELGRWGGARVVTTVSSAAKAELASAAGAHETIMYRAPDAAAHVRAAALDGVDRIVEVALRANLELNLSVAKPGAVITTYADGGAGDPAIPVRRLMTPNLTLRFLFVFTLAPAALTASADGVTAALRAGALSTLPVHRFPLEQTAAAHDAVEAGAVGKILIDIP
jgi:NADPH:quinone reductase